MINMSKHELLASIENGRFKDLFVRYLTTDYLKTNTNDNFNLGLSVAWTMTAIETAKKISSIENTEISLDQILVVDLDVISEVCLEKNNDDERLIIDTTCLFKSLSAMDMETRKFAEVSNVVYPEFLRHILPFHGLIQYIKFAN